jgi:small-conductance mechanosensitive channel
MSELRFEIDRVFRQKGIEIPFPQREIHLRQGAIARLS